MEMNIYDLAESYQKQVDQDVACAYLIKKDPDYITCWFSSN